MSISGDARRSEIRAAQKAAREAEAARLGFSCGTYDNYQRGNVYLRRMYNSRTDTVRWVVYLGNPSGAHKHVSFKTFEAALERAALVAALG